MIRACAAADAAAICAIYNAYVLDTVITFEEQPVAEAEKSAASSIAGSTWGTGS